MKIPSEIKHNGITYAVKEVEKLDGEESYGRTSYRYCEICLEEKLPQEKKEETLFHELMHIAFASTGLDFNRRKEEQFVSAWSKNIYGILKDNDFLK